VAENGAVALTRGHRPGVLRKLYLQDEAERAANFARMQQVAQRIVREVPGATISRDSGGRETDIAIDHGEFAHLPQEAIERVVALMRSEGMNATVSSIHINGWYGDHHKLAGARWIVQQLLGRSLAAERDRWVYVGDSTNDVLMFQHFPHSVGVANIRRFEAQLSHKPRYVTEGERGAGFAQVAAAILAAR
jgi:hydroxymethylpyrimidine pyrophosphatase-like HAD family hydrolase